MKFQIITYYPELYASLRLKEELENFDFQVQCLCPEDLTEKDQNHPKILRLGRYNYEQNLKILSQHKGPFFNSLESFVKARNKWTTYQKLSGLIPMPFSSKEELPRPCLLKLDESTKGEGIFLLTEKTEQVKILEPFFYQEFVQESAGHDYRVLMIESDFVGAIERKNPQNFRANSVYGNQAQAFSPPPKLLEISKIVMKELGLFYSALDFVKNKDNEFLLLEANASSGFQQFEAVTKVNFAQTLAQKIHQRIRNGSNS